MRGQGEIRGGRLEPTSEGLGQLLQLTLDRIDAAKSEPLSQSFVDQVNDEDRCGGIAS